MRPYPSPTKLPPTKKDKWTATTTGIAPGWSLSIGYQTLLIEDSTDNGLESFYVTEDQARRIVAILNETLWVDS